MYKVYAYSLLNIAASIAPDANTGLFADRDPYISYKPILKLNFPYSNVVFIPTPDILTRTITSGPLAKRR